MFTNNFIKFQKAMFWNGDTADGRTVKLIDSAGVSCTSYLDTGNYAGLGRSMKYGRCTVIQNYTGRYTSLSSSNVYAGVYFGSGSTPAAKADYKLESPITNGLSITNPNSVMLSNPRDGRYEAVSDFILRNTSNAEITIREIGLFIPLMNSADGVEAALSTTVTYNVLAERTVLTEPVTIPSGEARLVEYKIVFNQGENV